MPAPLAYLEMTIFILNEARKVWHASGSHAIGQLDWHVSSVNGYCDGRQQKAGHHLVVATSGRLHSIQSQLLVMWPAC